MNSVLRSLSRDRAFTAVAIATLAFGIGLTTTAVSLLEALLLRPAPFGEPQRLYRIEGLAPTGAEAGLSVPEIVALEEALAAVAETAPFRWVDVAHTEPGAPAENYVALSVTGQLFPVLAVPAQLGRTFAAADLATPDAPVAVLGHDLWQRRFGGDPDVIGRTIRLSGRSVTVLGVMPPSFNYRQLWGYGELWMPGAFMRNARQNYEARQHALVARLHDSATAAELRALLAASGARFASDHPQTNTGRSFRAVPLHESTVSPTLRRLSYLAFGVAAIVLLIICTNLANLQLSRGLTQLHEYSVRAAIGATPARLLRERLRENLLLGLVGGLFGCLLAAWGASLLSAHVVVGTSGRPDLRLDLSVLLVSLGLSVGTSLAFGIAPALLAARANVADALRQQSRSATSSRRHRHVRLLFTIVQIALALALLTGAGMMIRSLGDFVARPVGWNTRQVAFGTIALPGDRYGTPELRREFHRRLEAELLRQPGVTHATLSSLPPLQSYWHQRNFLPEGRTAGEVRDVTLAQIALVNPSFFETLGFTFLEGGSFRAGMSADDPPAIVINESLARAFWPGESAVGRRVADARGETWREIVGVVRDIDFPASTEAPLTPFQVYLPFVQEPWAYTTLTVRGPGGLAHLSDCLRRAVAALDPEVPVHQITDVPAVVARELHNLDLLTRALAGLALAGTALAGLGVFGVVAHDVARRRSEFAIRLALGARPDSLTALVLGHGARLALAGTALGWLAATGFARALEAWLPRVAEASPILFVMVAVFMAAVILLASWVPARRVRRMDPTEALRSE